MNFEYIEPDSITQFLNGEGLMCDFKSVAPSFAYTTYYFNFVSYPKNSILKKAIQNLERFTGSELEYHEGGAPNQFIISVKNEKRIFPAFLDYCNILASAPSGSMLLGLDEQNQPITASIYDTKSIFIGGASGGGKSVALHNLITSLMCYSNFEYAFIDLKKCEFEIYKNLPSLIAPVANAFNDAIKLLKRINDIIDKRYRIMAKKRIRKATEQDFQTLVCFIDEYALLTSQNQKDIDALVSRIASIGRACNCYIVIATQHATNAVISNTIRSNLQSRIGLRCMNTAQSMNIIGDSILTSLIGLGDAVISIDGVPKNKHVQICSLSDDDLQKIYNL